MKNMDTGELLNQIWQEVLNTKEINDSQNFFLSGGDSLLAVRFLTKCKDNRIPISIKDLYMLQSLGELKEHIIQKQVNDENLTSTVLNIKEKNHKLLPTQYRWVNEPVSDINHFNLGALYYTPIELTLEKLRDAIKIVIDRNEALRTAYKKVSTGWVAKVMPLT